MDKIFEDSFSKLQKFVEKEGYKGWDPYDGLNSTFFKSIPFINKSRFCKLAWIQFFKRSPINFRKIFGVKKGFNSKGLSLFLSGYCRLYKIDPNPNTLEKIIQLSNDLLEMKADGWSGDCWGYNFDWQARAFFQPKNTPTVVASVYVACSLLEAYEILENPLLLKAAESTCEFILKDLNRSYNKDGDFCFSYSPLDNSIVYNASLLGSRLLSKVYAINGNKLYKEEAKRSIEFCIKNQQSNGAWVYGQQDFHHWIDNFHTGFNLECIAAYQKNTGDASYSGAIELGFNYYINNFFESDGKAKYYNDKVYPIDIHAPSQLLVTLNELGLLKEHIVLYNKVILWTIQNMQDSEGFFYYQVGKNYTSRIPYMRWAQAWMFFAFSTLKNATHEN